MKKFYCLLIAFIVLKSTYAQNTYPYPSSGSIGIGTTSPQHLLDVNGASQRLYNATGSTNLRIEGNGTTNYAGSYLFLNSGTTKVGDTFTRGRIDVNRGTDSTANFQFSRMNGDTYTGIFYQYNDPVGHRFFTAATRSATTTGEVMRITKDGLVGIGNTSPIAKFEVWGNSGIIGRFRSTAGLPTESGLLEFQNGRSTVGYDGTSGGLKISTSDNGKPIIFSNSVSLGTGEYARFTGAGNMGIGTNTPTEKLHVNGNIRTDGMLLYGVSLSRTETRNDAGLQGSAGALSGFYQASAPVNFPQGATNWWHLLDVRHSSTSNNYAMQLAGSFFDQKLWFRKTNNNPSQAWTQIMTQKDMQTASIPTTNRSVAGLEKNLLFYANNRYAVNQSPATGGFDINTLFDGVMQPSYSTIAPTLANPFVLTIENLPDRHSQSGAWFGWSTRTWVPKKFKIEGYNIYVASGYTEGWNILADVTDNTDIEYLLKVPNGSYSKFRLTIYEGSGTDGRVGLSEIYYLHPEGGAAYEGLTVKYNATGNVGIGTTTPTTITGYTSMAVNNVSNGSIIDLMQNNSFKLRLLGQSTVAQLETNTNIPLLFNVGGTEKVRILSSGQIGIGTASVPAGFKMAVLGNIIAEEIKVRKQANGWPDYVFSPTYKLASLNEVEQFINKNSHLPEIPSAKEIEANGLVLGEMNAKLLRKIEELTLYIIEQNKKLINLEEQNKQIEVLKKEIKEIKELLKK